MNKNYIFIILVNVFITSLFARSMEFTSCKTYVKVEKNLEKGEEFGLLALEIESDNSYIPFFIGQFIYRKQKKRLEAGRMFLDAKKRSDMNIENPYRIGEDTWVRTVHEAIVKEGLHWFNYGKDAIDNKKYDDAIEHFEIASELDPALEGKCYAAISLIYFNNGETDKGLKFIDVALKKTSDPKVILDLKINKARYLRNNKQIEEAFSIFESIPEENMNLEAKNQLFLLYTDNNDCDNAIELGGELFITMEEDPTVSMRALSSLAFNIAACFNQKADETYNKIINYFGTDGKSNESTQVNLDRAETAKSYYSSAKDYYRLSLDYDEDSSEITKGYKRKMRKDIRKIDEQIIPTLESLLK